MEISLKYNKQAISEMSTAHELRKNIVSSIISFSDLIFSELPEKTRGDIIYSIHLYGFTAVILYVILFGRRFALQIFLTVGFIIIVQLFVLRGCVLTKVEQHYRKEKGTTVDIFLRFFEFPETNENRKLISLTGYSLIFLCVIGIYMREALFNTYV